MSSVSLGVGLRKRVSMGVTELSCGTSRRANPIATLPMTVTSGIMRWLFPLTVGCWLRVRDIPTRYELWDIAEWTQSSEQTINTVEQAMPHYLGVTKVSG